jgi:hypothetical protein
MEILFGWLTRDEFTNQSATYIKHDQKYGCDIWQHMSSPEYPAEINQTACVAKSDAYFKPVYMHYRIKKSISFELDEYAGFKQVNPSSFPQRTFDPPKNCPIMPGNVATTPLAHPGRVAGRRSGAATMIEQEKGGKSEREEGGRAGSGSIGEKQEGGGDFQRQ